MSRLARLLFPTLTLVFATFQIGGQTPANPLGSPFSATAAELKAASAAVPVIHQYGVQILWDEATYAFANDGTLKYQQRLIYRLDDAAAVKDWAEISEQWEPWYEKPAVLKARVLQADGKFVELDQKTITDAPVKAEDDETFSSEHVRRAPLPGLSVGAIVEEVRAVEESQPYFIGGEVYRYFFRESVPVAHERVTVELPAAMALKDKVIDVPGLSVARTESGGRNRVVYEAEGIPAFHDSDIDLSTDSQEGARLQFATGRSWADVATAYAALSEPQMVIEDVSSAMPDSLPADRIGKIRAIVSQLHRQARYTGVEFGDAKLTPQRPSAVLQRHYGDCKDKATLLVAMLRKADIAANLALLSVGPGRDLDPELPGMNDFDHAIVYLPGTANGDKPLWIDATAEFSEVGTLPYMDQGRKALVIAPATRDLVKTPEPTPEDSVLTETRTFTLSGYGPAHVQEVSETHGYIDASYRSSYGGENSPKVREQLEDYVRRYYLAKSLTTLKHGDAADLVKPFNLTLEAVGAKRGTTDIASAVVVLFPNSAADELPRWFQQQPPAVTASVSADEKQELELAKQSRRKTYVIQPFITERRTRILIPEGYVLRALPPNKTTQMGSATFTETYDATEPGVVMATYRFVSGPPHVTADQALAMRDAVLEFKKRDWVGIYFDQVGAKALAAGNIRDAIKADHELIAAHPDDALQHARLARVLLDAGIGTEAHAEAKRATELDPKSAIAWATLGWTLEHDGLGVRFGNRYNRAGAIAALKQAFELDPENNGPLFDLAVQYEFDARGARYTPEADLPKAIETYRTLIDKFKDTDEQQVNQSRENLVYALLFSKKFAEVDKLLADMPSSAAHLTCAITSAVAQHGIQAGIAQADRGNESTADRNKNLITAGRQLAMLHMYGEAADILGTGMQGDGDAAAVARLVELYRSIKPDAVAPLPPTNPAKPVKAIVYAGLSGAPLTRELLMGILSHHAYPSQASMDLEIAKAQRVSGVMKRVAAKSEMPESVLVDLVMGSMTLTSSGDDSTGYVVVEQSAGAAPQQFYVVKEDGAYRIVATANDNSEVGYAALWALEHNNTAQAKALLDWKRDLTRRANGDDPFEGPMLPRFWTIGSSKAGADSPEAMRLAAISLTAGSMAARKFLPELTDMRNKATGQRQTDLDLLLMRVAIGCEDPDLALTSAKHLLDQEPDSLSALRIAGLAYGMKRDAKSWIAMLQPLVDKKPKDHDLLFEQSRAYSYAHDWQASQEALRKVLDSGKATESDYNMYAWLGLFHQALGDDILKAAQQSTMIGKNSEFGSLHTLACIYAAQGHATEARQVLRQAMDAANLDEPNSAVWYVLGLVYEQYSDTAAALDAYRRVAANELDDHTFIDATSTYVLAQERLKAIAAAQQPKAQVSAAGLGWRSADELAHTI